MTRVLPADDAGAILEAAATLRAGGLVAFPTETVYGLGADAAAPQAVAKIYAAKGRPAFNPLIAHVADLDAAAREALLPPAALALGRVFWPGPLTLVAPAAPGCSVCDLARAGLASLALRVPAHGAALALLRAFGGPVVAPSANLSGRVSPVTAAHVAEDLAGRVDLILDGGRTTAGLESTIVSFVGPQPALLRPGAVPREALEAALGCALVAPSAGVEAPGMLASHYAPRARLRLAAERPAPDETCLDFGGRFGGAALDLSPCGDLTEAAANLYDYLRRLDATGCEKIAVAPVPPHGLGAAINDRLRRAAAPR